MKPKTTDYSFLFIALFIWFSISFGIRLLKHKAFQGYSDTGNLKYLVALVVIFCLVAAYRHYV